MRKTGEKRRGGGCSSEQGPNWQAMAQANRQDQIIPAGLFVDSSFPRRKNYSKVKKKKKYSIIIWIEFEAVAGATGCIESKGHGLIIKPIPVVSKHHQLNLRHTTSSRLLRGLAKSEYTRRLFLAQVVETRSYGTSQSLLATTRIRRAISAAHGLALPAASLCLSWLSVSSMQVSRIVIARWRLAKGLSASELYVQNTLLH
ncbi:hypothetical protein BJX62DRAFT_185276 [Aspergillus germanicus]